MVTGSFRINQHLAEIGALTGTELGREDFIREVLKLMQAMGFERARFWEAGHDLSTGGPVVILIDRLPEDDPSCAKPGHQLRWDESDTAQSAASLEPVVTVTSTKGPHSPVERELGLAGRVRVEIRVTAGMKTESFLACDWRGRRDQLSDSDLDALRLVGSHIGSHLGLESVGSRGSSTQTRAERPDQPPAETVHKAARDFGMELDAAITSIFSFSWSDQQLIKGREFVAEPFKANAQREGRLDEVYAAGGPALTGKAWQDPDFRQIISFTGLKEKYKLQIDQESLDWHTAVLGKIHTVLYAVVGTLEQRYLIRMMNRASRPELPFLREGRLLDAAIQDLSTEVDAAISLQRLKSLQDISGLSAESQDLNEIFDTIATSLKGERIESFVALCHQRNASQFSFVRGQGQCEQLELDLDRRWQDDSLYKAAVSDKLNVAVLSEHGGRSELADQLARKGFKAVLGQPMQAGQTEGVFFVGLTTFPPRARDRKRELPDKLGYGTTALIHAYSRLLANAVEMMHSHERVIGARRAYGLMGHEVRRPAAALGSAGLNAVHISLKVTKEIPDPDVRAETEAMLSQAKTNVRVAQRRLGSALRLANLISRESEGTLRLKFEPVDLRNVLRRAVDDVTLQVKEERARFRPYFTFNDATARLGSLVCSEDYVEEALRNVLLNAVKYSLPRKVRLRAGSQPVRVAVYAIPQEAWVGIQIRNWGWGIRRELRDVIFDPWVRGYEEVGTDALSGMGLGLFLARRLIVAHGGEILSYSHPTDDRFFPKPPEASDAPPGVPTDKPEPVVIHETTFELRIPRGLTAGDHTHRWGPASRSDQIRDT